MNAKLTITLLLCTFLGLAGCLKRAAPEPRTAVMDRYYETFTRTQRQFDAKAIEDTLAKIDQFDEAQTRDHLAAGIKASTAAAGVEAGSLIVELEEAEFSDDEGNSTWTRGKAKALYGGLLEEIRAHE